MVAKNPSRPPSDDRDPRGGRKFDSRSIGGPVDVDSASISRAGSSKSVGRRFSLPIDIAGILRRRQEIRSKTYKYIGFVWAMGLSSVLLLAGQSIHSSGSSRGDFIAALGALLPINELAQAVVGPSVFAAVYIALLIIGKRYLKSADAAFFERVVEDNQRLRKEVEEMNDKVRLLEEERNAQRLEINALIQRLQFLETAEQDGEAD